MQFLVPLLNSQKSLFPLSCKKEKNNQKNPPQTKNPQEATNNNPKQQQKERVTMMPQYNKTVSLFEIILQANRVNAVLKYN